MMADLRTLLHEAAGPVPDEPQAAAVDASLAAGRRIVRRRRLGVAAGSGVVAAALATVLVLPNLAPAGTRLVSYTGRQPVGFLIDRVPEDWHVQSIDSSSLMLAPDDMRGVSTDPRVFDGKVTVVLEVGRPDLILPAGAPRLEVAGRPGVMFHNAGDDGTRTLFVQQPARTLAFAPCTPDELRLPDREREAVLCGTVVRHPYLAVQVPGRFGWTDRQIVELARGIHVTADSTTSPRP